VSALDELAGTHWAGQAELWLDEHGNEALMSDAVLDVSSDAVEYRWSYEGKPQNGRLALRPGGADFTDTFHSQAVMPCVARAGALALVDITGRYACGDGTDWAWRITLAHRPSGELVLQMTNVAPWGEEYRAVRMVCTRKMGAS
jgi:hypothetical protein